MNPSARARATKLGTILALGVAAALAGLLLNSYWTGVVSQALMMGTAAVALDILVGWCGMASLGHAAYFGVAGYVLAVMATRYQMNPWLAALIGIVAVVILALAIGPLAVRTRGLAFLTVTLAFGECIWGVATDWRSVTGGSDGIPGVPRPNTFLGLSLVNPRVFYLLCVIVAAVIFVVVYRFMRGPFGLQLRGVRLSELRLRSLGYDATRLRVAAFVISAAIIGVCGVVFTFFNQYVGTNTLDWRLSAQMLLAVVVGGPGTLWGPFVAGFGLFFVQIFATNVSQRWILILGFIYILSVLLLPRGIASLIRRRTPRSASGQDTQAQVGAGALLKPASAASSIPDETYGKSDSDS